MIYLIGKTGPRALREHICHKEKHRNSLQTSKDIFQKYLKSTVITFMFDCQTTV
jgi:hypothetical protein